MSVTDGERTVLARLADVLIPAGQNMPSASQAGVSGPGLDKVLSSRPDLVGPLRNLLQQVKGRAPAEFVEWLQSSDPAAFGILEEVVPAAYFLDLEVRKAIGYAGQGARSIDPHPDYLDDGLLDSVVGRGPIYRATRQA